VLRPTSRLAHDTARTAAGAAALSGCAEHHPPPDAQSEYVDLYLDDGIRACGGVLASYDHFIERAFDAWAQLAPDDFRVRVKVDPDVGCGEHLGCAVHGKAWINAPDAQYHELAHTVTFEADGYSVPSLRSKTSRGSSIPSSASRSMMPGPRS
jgi:hypothetical protein